MQASSGYHLFSTDLGICGIAWGPEGIVATGLPERDEAVLVERLRRRSRAEASEPPDTVAEAIAEIRSLMAGEPRDLLGIRLDMAGLGAFEAAVYRVTRAIPPGETLTYGEVARAIGEAGASRAVGRALGANPFPIVVPCHRVLAAGGKSGGFSADGGIGTKFRLLAIERARRGSAPTLFDDDPAFVLKVPPR